MEERYFTDSYSAILVEDGTVGPTLYITLILKTGGVLVVVSETTEQVLRERELRLLRDMVGQLTPPNIHEACMLMMNKFSTNPTDIPFACIYDLKDKEICLFEITGIERGTAVSPERFSLDQKTNLTFENTLIRVATTGKKFSRKFLT
jgi:hypothetical protein